MRMQHDAKPAPLDTCSGFLFEPKKKASVGWSEYARLKTLSDDDQEEKLCTSKVEKLCRSVMLIRKLLLRASSNSAAGN